MIGVETTKASAESNGGNNQEEEPISPDPFFDRYLHGGSS
jgi:hypothetical protein